MRTGVKCHAVAVAGTSVPTDSAAGDVFLDLARTGPAGLIVEGDAGIGKTTLWLDVIDAAQARGFRVLSARTSAAEAVMGFATVADLLADVDNDIIDSLPEIQRLALDRVLLRGGDRADVTDEHVVAAGFRNVVDVAATRSPVLVAIDDAQWLDLPSRMVVAFAARRLRNPVGVLVTARTDEPGSPHPAAWLQLPRPELLSRKVLQPLTLGSLHAVIAAHLGRTLPRPLIARIHQVSAGNPFYGLELARFVSSGPFGHKLGLPETLSRLIADRVDALADDTVRVLLAAACAHSPTVAQLAGATGMTFDAVVTALQEAEASDVLRIDGTRVQFSHPLLAHGVYSRADPAERRLMHRSLATTAEVSEVRARHLALASVGPEATLAALDSAADAATRRGAPSVAAELLDLAIDLAGGDPIRELRAAEQLFRAGEHQEVERRLERLLPALPDGVLRSVALMLRGAVYGYGSRLADAVDVLNEAVSQAGDSAALSVRGRLLLALAKAAHRRPCRVGGAFTPPPSSTAPRWPT